VVYKYGIGFHNGESVGFAFVIQTQPFKRHSVCPHANTHAPQQAVFLHRWERVLGWGPKSEIERMAYYKFFNLANVLTAVVVEFRNSKDRKVTGLDHTPLHARNLHCQVLVCIVTSLCWRMRASFACFVDMCVSPPN
jgi:hypothetical protein